MGVKKGDGIVPMEERLVASDISRYKLVRKNWFAYNPMRLNIGSIARWEGDGDVLVSPDYVVFRCLERSMPTTLLPKYLDSFRCSWQWETFVNEAGDGGVRVRIYYRDLAQLRLALPGVEEQQKIADCLGSLDELVGGGGGRKLEALQRHKQGLMQQLFPKPGETLPQMRFAEFANLPGWELRQLSDVLDYEQPGKYIVTDTNYYNAGTPVLTANKSFILGHTGETDGIYHDVPVIIFDDFTTDAKYVDFPFKVKSSAIKILKPRGDDELRLVYELMSRIRFDPTQHKRYWISQYQYLKIPLPYKSEQRRIVDCLGSLDELITAEGRKLEVLRQHKKGLMQQLFPSPKEGNS
ncbi:MAG: restriction endonuclease subunit S [Gammaproteobacteria bacterium]|nr:restriction endonuclease subunit S [Gammaproteobacteria bacterium]